MSRALRGDPVGATSLGSVGQLPAVDYDGKRISWECHTGGVASRAAFEQLLKLIGPAEHGHLLTTGIDTSQHSDMSERARIAHEMVRER
jgi:hypothetical protein